MALPLLPGRACWSGVLLLRWRATWCSNGEEEGQQFCPVIHPHLNCTLTRQKYFSSLSNSEQESCPVLGTKEIATKTEMRSCEMIAQFRMNHQSVFIKVHISLMFCMIIQLWNSQGFMYTTLAILLMTLTDIPLFSPCSPFLYYFVGWGFYLETQDDSMNSMTTSTHPQPLTSF